MQEQAQLVNSDYQRSLLSGLDLFCGVIPDDIQNLLQQCERRDAGAGELLLSPGTCNDSVFVVLSGGLNVHVGCPDTSPVATLRIGACAGEMSIIEERDPSEVTARFPARNPAFDVTPAALISAIVTERGVHRAPYEDSLR